MVGVLGGEDMVVHGALVKVGVTGFGRKAEKAFGEFQHVVGVTGFRSFAVFHVAFAVIGGGKMFPATVSSYGKAAVVHYGAPEEIGGFPVGVGIRCTSGKGAEFGYTLVTHDFGDLGIGMLVV